jgi:membrane fusion protein (multidrug efflux system)
MAQSSSTQEEADSGTELQKRSKGDRTRRNGPRRRILGAAAVVLALVGLVVGIYYYLYAISHESTDDAYIDGHIIAISPRVSGHVVSVYVTDNQKVAAGDLLVELDPHYFQARLDAARASLDAAEAGSRSRDIDINLTAITATAGLDEAKAAVTTAEAMVQNAQALAARPRWTRPGPKSSLWKPNISKLPRI